MDYAAARENMVECQLRTNKVVDPRLLEAFETVPRELFVPAAKRDFAYVDEDIPLGGGRYVMEPMVLARLLQAAEVKASDIVIDIGCGTGYATAILSHLAATVVALESDKGLAKMANKALAELGIDNAAVVEGRLTEGYPRQAPYNVILLNGAVGEVPPAVSDQLAEGGRLVAVVKDGPGMGQAILLQRTGGGASSRVVFDAATPVLPGFARESGFVF